MEKRQNWPDYAKAIGIILVVYGHVARGLEKGGINAPFYNFELVDSIIYSFHMPLFFFLSGLFFCYSFFKKGSRKLVFSKIDTIFYPYVLWSLLQGGIEILLSNYTNGTIVVSDVLSFLWAPRAQFWFLYALFFIFILSSLIYSKIPDRFSIYIFVFSLVIYLYPVLLPDVYILKTIASYFVFFMLGIIFTRYFKVEYFLSLITLSVLFIAFIIGQWLFHYYMSYKYTDSGILLFLLTCISITFVVSLSSFLSTFNYKVLAYVGSSSMAIFLMHILIGSGTRVILSKLFGIDAFVIHLLLGCLAGIVGPIFALYLIKKLNVKFVFSAPVSAWCSALRIKIA